MNHCNYVQTALRICIFELVRRYLDLTSCLYLLHHCCIETELSEQQELKEQCTERIHLTLSNPALETVCVAIDYCPKNLPFYTVDAKVGGSASYCISVRLYIQRKILPLWIHRR